MGGLEAAWGAGQRDGIRRPVYRGRRAGGALRKLLPRHLEPGAGEGRAGSDGGSRHRLRRPGGGGSTETSHPGGKGLKANIN